MEKARKPIPKQQRFADEFLCNLNAKEAAIKAGYSPKTAEQIGYQLLQKTSVQEYLARRMKEREKRTEITQDRVLAELALIAFGRQSDLMTWGPAGVVLKDSEQLTGDATAMVAEVSETVTLAGGTVKIKTHDKVRALELVGKHLGMFANKLEVTGNDGGPIELLDTDRVHRLHAIFEIARARQKEQQEQAD